MLFKQLYLSSQLQLSLAHNNFEKLTNIQEKVLPTTLAKKSVIITSNTGTGKTLCYVLPILNNLNDQTTNLVVVPTKELARQVYSSFLLLASKNNIQLVIGDNNNQARLQTIKHQKPDVIVTTPLWALRLFQEKYITHQVQTVVFDEVDMTLDLGFFNHINQLMSIIDHTQLQKIACSATTHDSLANQLKKYFANTKVISETNTIWSNQLVSHNLVYTSDFVNPNKTLLGLLKIIKPFCCLIFANTIKDSQMLYELLIQNQYNACLINKDISSRERKRLFNEINKSKYQYVVCTDLLSRGVDIVAIDTVINYGLPNDDIWYMHRIGRTGRNNKPGTSYTIYTQNIDNIINRLSHKKINWNYFLISNGQLINKPLKLRLRKPLRFDKQTNDQIRRIIFTNSKRVKPCYKKKIKEQLHNIKQQKKHEYIDKKYKQIQLQKNIERTKKLKHR